MTLSQFIDRVKSENKVKKGGNSLFELEKLGLIEILKQERGKVIGKKTYWLYYFTVKYNEETFLLTS